MSCLDKLKKLNPLPAIDKAFRSLSPSNIGKMSSKLKLSTITDKLEDIAGDIKDEIEKQIQNFTDEVTGKLTEVKKLVGDFASDLKAGLNHDLKGIKTTTVNLIQSAKTEIKEQLNNVKDLLDCEFETTYNENTQVQEATKLKSNVMGYATTQTSKLSNKDIKRIQEDPQFKAEKVAKITDDTKTNGAKVIANSKSNKQVVETHDDSLATLKTASVPIDDKYSADVDQELLSYYKNKVKEVATVLDKLNKAKFSVQYKFESNYDTNKSKIKNALYNVIIPNTELLSKEYNQGNISISNTNLNLELNNLNLDFALQGGLYLLQQVSIEDYRAFVYPTIKLIKEKLTSASTNKQPIIVVVYKTNIVSI